MIRRVWTAALVAFAVGLVSVPSMAQTPKGQTAKGGATKTEPAKPDTPKPDAKAKFDAIVERMEKARQDFMAELKAAKPQDQEALYKKRPGAEFLPEFKALAQESKGTDIAAKSWIQVVELGAQFDKPDEVKGAVDTLLSDYIKSPAIEELPSAVAQLNELLGADKAEQALRDIAEKSPHKSVRAGATFALAQMLFEASTPTSPQGKDARKLFEKVIADFPDVKASRGPSYKEMAEGVLFELDHLQIGMQAPDFETTDENGQKFKLSDYKGKVVVVDFWGFW